MQTSSPPLGHIADVAGAKTVWLDAYRGVCRSERPLWLIATGSLAGNVSANAASSRASMCRSRSRCCALASTRSACFPESRTRPFDGAIGSERVIQPTSFIATLSMQFAGTLVFFLRCFEWACDASESELPPRYSCSTWLKTTRPSKCSASKTEAHGRPRQLSRWASLVFARTGT